MEDVLAVYTRPRDPDCPLVCVDETSKQLLAETRVTIPMKPGRPARFDYEYERNGTANLFMMFAPLVKARVKVRDYPDGTLAIFHGPRCLCRFEADGGQIAAPTRPSMASCSTPSRRGLDAPTRAAPTAQRPALTGSRHEAKARPRVGTKKRASRSNKETGLQSRPGAL